MEPTAFQKVNALLDRLLEHIRKVLGEKLVGLYLYGSLVTGDFDVDISDVDLLAVLTTDPDRHELTHLREMHEAFARANKDWEDRIEVAYVGTEALRSFRERTSKIAVISPGEPFHVKDAGIDWLINWYIIRAQGLPLFGPPPSAVIEPIMKEEFIAAVRSQANEWGEYVTQMETRPAQAYAILTLCRALCAYRTGDQLSKKAAALWAKNELPEWSGLIQDALIWRKSWRESGVDHSLNYTDTVRFVRDVRNRIMDN